MVSVRLLYGRLYTFWNISSQTRMDPWAEPKLSAYFLGYPSDKHTSSASNRNITREPSYLRCGRNRSSWWRKLNQYQDCHSLVNERYSVRRIGCDRFSATWYRCMVSHPCAQHGFDPGATREGNVIYPSQH